jgi:FtsP/CotA-like multicopper oxidase with cupredoxin domain
MSAQQIQKRAAGSQPASQGASSCPENAAGSEISPPTDLFSQNGVLEVTLNFQTDVDSTGAQRYCYVTNTNLVSPTLRVNPGDTLLIHFYNQLPAGLNPSIPQMKGMPNMPSMSQATVRGMAAGLQTTLPPTARSAVAGAPICNLGAMSASVSNMHFHGLNVSPACGSDEVVNTLIEPGQEFDYTIQIPSNEPAGLYWYHPHPHGFSEGQVQGGASGAIIVEGLQAANPSLVGLPEQTLILRDQLTPLSQQSNAAVPAWDISLDFVPILFPAYTPAQLTVTPSQQQVWRVVNAAADTIFNLQYVVAGTAQSVSVVAIDGVSVTGGAIQESSILLGPGSRAEFVVTTPAVGEDAQLVTQNIDTGPDGDYDPDRPIANIVASTTAPALPILNAIQPPTTSIGIPVARRFAALPQATSVAQRTLYFSEVLTDPTNPNSPTNFYITQDGETPELFTMGQAPNIVVHSGTVETWVIQNRAMEDHVFHIHQIHFQVMAINGVAVNDPAIRDTYVVPYWTGVGPYPSVTVAMDFRDPNIIGTFVYHCHILGHEDGGMMGVIQVLPPGTASTTVISSSGASVTPVSTVTLTATVASSAGGSTPTGQVQFQANGVDVGNPATLAGGVATVSVSGSLFQYGTNGVQAFYMGDSNYVESVSGTTTVTDAPFGITGAATTVLGIQANASLQVVTAIGYTNTVTLTCALPSAITGSTCAVYPATVTGGGPATLAMVTTVAHSDGPKMKRRSLTLPASAFAVAALLIPFVKRKRKLKALLSMLALFLLSGLLALSGCTGSVSDAKAQTPTPAGTYSVTVTGVGSSGGASYTATAVVPITVQ